MSLAWCPTPYLGGQILSPWGANLVPWGTNLGHGHKLLIEVETKYEFADLRLFGIAFYDMGRDSLEVLLEPSDQLDHSVRNH